MRSRTTAGPTLRSESQHVREERLLRRGDEILARFTKAGIDITALAVQLQDEGASAFVKSWKELMECIASKSETHGNAT